MDARKLWKLPAALLARLNRTAARDGVDANEILRIAAVKELDLMDRTASVEKQRMEKLRVLAAAKGGNVDAAIDELLKQFTDPALPGMASMASAPPLPDIEPLARRTGTEG